MRRLFLILILLLPCAVSLAQTYTISGTVVNKRTKTPVEFATVVAVAVSYTHLTLPTKRAV